MEEINKWLLEGEPWVEYRTRVDLLEQSENESEVIHARKEMIDHPKIQLLLEELKNWPGTVLSSHKSAKQSFHKLSFIADLGLKSDDPPISEILKKISEDELRHYNQWKKYTQADVNVNRLSVIKYLIISKIFGLLFMMKLMEGNEEQTQATYSKILKDLPEEKQILAEEIEHEKLLIEMIDEKRLNYLSSIISGLNDALIELA